MKLAVMVKNLAPAQHVAQGSSVYVVWAQPPQGNGPPSNLGVLSVGKDLSDSLKTTITARDIDLSVTPEPSATMRQPSNEPVLTAQVRPSK